jgi:hypothetical protein
MPVTPTYPGVYIDEVPSGVRSITGVATSIAAFVGRAWKGPLDEPVTIAGYAGYERVFGGLWSASTMSYAVQQFFLNGGSQALVVRVASKADFATLDLGGGTTLRAASAGTWGRNLQVTVDSDTKNKIDKNLFNLTIDDVADAKNDDPKRGGSGAREIFLNVSSDAASPRFMTTVLAQQSNLVRVQKAGGAPPPAVVKASVKTGSDGAEVGAADVVGNEANKLGMYALLKADIFNLLCIPPFKPDTPDNGLAVWVPAAKFCKDRRAFLIIDAGTAWKLDPADAKSNMAALAIERSYAAVFFPRVRMSDPLQDGNLADFAPSGAVAGVISRTDAERGVWKAPAGVDAGLRGVIGLSITGQPGAITDNDSGNLNPSGVNCLRAFPATGHVIWGARTADGADALASPWKYIPVRRLALYLEESLYRGTQWVVFEPNDEPLWSQIRLNVGAFLHTLFQQGAFQGTTPREAYFVKCDRETTTQNDINAGIVNIVVGFAPLKPAEFVVIKIQQMAGQIDV